MIQNPYVREGKAPTLRNSVFVFMDILGYSEMIRESQQNKVESSTLIELHAALSYCRKSLAGTTLLTEEPLDELFALKAFTDNIVLGWPIFDDAESELGSAFMRVSEFQFNMAIRGYFLRGAISIGTAYIDEIAVFGSALTESYEGESKLARDPRIILTKTAKKVTDSHLEYYFPPSESPQNRDLLKDADGQYFLNYLQAVMIAEYEHGPFYDELLQHKSAVEKRLSEHKNNPVIWVKYAWTANYHNHFCDSYPQYFDESHRINVDLFKNKFSLITTDNSPPKNLGNSLLLTKTKSKILAT